MARAAAAGGNFLNRGHALVLDKGKEYELDQILKHRDWWNRFGPNRTCAAGSTKVQRRIHGRRLRHFGGLRTS